MSDIQYRLIQEYDELTGKIVKLNKSLTSDSVEGISAMQLSLMRVQVHAMRTYATCLMNRIEDLKFDRDFERMVKGT